MLGKFSGLSNSHRGALFPPKKAEHTRGHVCALCGKGVPLQASCWVTANTPHWTDGILSCCFCHNKLQLPASTRSSVQCGWILVMRYTSCPPAWSTERTHTSTLILAHPAALLWTACQPACLQAMTSLGCLALSFHCCKPFGLVRWLFVCRWFPALPLRISKQRSLLARRLTLCV